MTVPKVFTARTIAVALAAWLSLFALALSLYWPVLNAFPIYDELTLLEQYGVLRAEWADVMRVQRNGFFRPAGALIVRGLSVTFGENWIPFHAANLALVAAVAALTMLMARRAWGAAPWAAWAAGVLVVIHPVMAEAAISWAVMFDPLVLCGLLIALLGWIGGYREKSGAFVIVCCGVMLAVASKESAFVAPLLMLAFAPALGRPPRSVIPSFVLTCLLCAVAASFSAYQIATARTSYLTYGQVSLSAIGMVRSYLDHLFSALWPFVFAEKWPWSDNAPTQLMLHGCRLATIIVAAVTLAWAWRTRRQNHGVPLALAVCVGVAMLPAAIYTGPVQGRYVVLGIPFVALLAAWALERLWLRRHELLPRVGLVILASLFVVFLAGTLRSHRTAQHAATAGKVRQLVAELRRLAPQWPERSVIAIVNHPHVAAPPHDWIYARHIMVLFLPERNLAVQLSSNTQTPFNYRFSDDGQLVPLRDSTETSASR